ncbi:MAG: gliding motility-associated protein GldE [Bacteroidota bacterium]|nr:gliding motility-associated protein GldE [Bacteroidota bacterium]
MSNLYITFNPVSFGSIAGIVVIGVLLFITALFSGAEIAFFSLRPVDIEKLKHKGTKRSKIILRFLENPQNLLATILVANNFINVGIVILSAWTTNSLINFTNSPILGFVIQVVCISFILLLFGEILPKVYASQKPLRMAGMMAAPLLFLSKIQAPINQILIHSTSFVRRRYQKHGMNISIDEISDALELTTGEDIRQDKEILEGIVKFGNISVSEIMRPRMDVVALDISDSFGKVLSVVNESGYSRIPVFDDNFDNIKGVLHVKDLLPHIPKGANFRWQSLIRQAFYVPETKKIDDLLREFQKNKVHIAVVVDEYGGTSGIVTLEDILEEIVGDISDEFDVEENMFTRLTDTKYLFDAKILLNDFYKIVECDDDIFDRVRGDADTLAGLILEIKGEMPAKHEVFKLRQFKFSIEAVDNRRIKQVMVEILPQEDNETH